MHKDMINYIAGTMNEKNLSASDAVLAVHAEFAADPQARAENADMLVGFDPATVTVDDLEQIILSAGRHRRVHRLLGATLKTVPQV